MPAVSALVKSPSTEFGPTLIPQGSSIDEMRAFLVRARPGSAADALRLLRAAFPDAPLAERVAACGLSGD